MWETLASLPVLVCATFVQIGVFGRIHLINGSADLLMLIVIAWSLNSSARFGWIWAVVAGLIMSYVSAMPLSGYFIVYILIWLIILFLKKNVWHMPVVLMLFLTIVGTIMESGFSLAVLTLKRASINYLDAIQRIVVPSLVMNLILSIPVYAFMRDFADTIYFNEITEE